MANVLSQNELTALDAYWRAANYLSVGQIYLLDNPLLKEPLQAEHVKPRLLGHWGTTPGLNFIYVHLNRVIRQERFEHDLHRRARSRRPRHRRQHLSRGHLQRSSIPTSPGMRKALKSLFKQFSFPGRDSEPRRAGDARLDPRGRRARLRAVARLWRGVRQPRSDRLLASSATAKRKPARWRQHGIPTNFSTRRATARCCRSCI